MPDPRPNPEDEGSSEVNQRRTLKERFIAMMNRGNRDRMPRQKPPKESPQIGPPQAEAPPSNKKSSTISPGQRIRVSAPFSLFLGHGISDYLIQRVVMFIDEPPVRSIVHLFTNTMIYYSTQEEPTQKPPPSGEHPVAPPHSESSPTNTPDDTKPESSGVQHVVEVMVSFVPSEAKAHVCPCSMDLKNRRTIFLVWYRYLRGFVAVVGDIVVGDARPATTPRYVTAPLTRHF